MAWYSDLAFAAGDIPTAATLNKIPSNFGTLAPAGDPSVAIAYSSTWAAAGTAVDLGNGTVTAWYGRVGGLVWVSIKVTAGSSTTFGTGMLSVTLPVLPKVDGTLFHGWINDSGTGYQLLGRSASTTVNLYHAESATDGLVNQTTGTAPVALGSGDTIEVNGTYWAY